MARTTNRSPEDRLRIGRMVCIGGEMFELAICVVLLFLLGLALRNRFRMK